MGRTTKADPELDGLIAEITIDCRDEDEALQAFQDAFDEDANLPLPGSVIGERVEGAVRQTASSARDRRPC